MVAFFAVSIAIACCYILAFLYQLYFVYIFIKGLSNENLKQLQVCKKGKKNKKAACFIKRKKAFVLRLCKLHIQSKSFYLKNLYEKSYDKVSFAQKLIIDKVYKKLFLNYPTFVRGIDFDRIYNSGLFNGKPILKIELPKNKSRLENLLIALREVKKYIDFRVIFLVDAESRTDFVAQNSYNLDYKFVNPEDINLFLLQELNKVNLNYNSDYLPSPKIDTDFTSKSEWKIIRFFNFNKINLEEFKEKNLCYYFKKNNDKKDNIKIFLKLKSIYFNYKIDKNNLSIKYFDNKYREINYCCSKNIKKIYFFRKNNDTFVSLEFILNDRELFVIENAQSAEIARERVLFLLMKSKLDIEKLFNIKIYTKNKKFNDFFNKELKEKILEEKYNQNCTEKYKNNINYMFISKLFKLNYKELVLHYKSYLSIYELLINEIFGIKINKNILEVNPNKKRFDEMFKLVVNYEGNPYHIFVQQGEECKLKVGNIVYSNLKFIDLKMLRENANLVV